MKIQLTISSELGRELTDLQAALGTKNIEDLTIHSWKVLHYLIKTIRNRHFTLSQEAIPWISEPTMGLPPPEPFQQNPDLSHDEIDNRIIQEIHQLLDNNQINQALKVTHILKILQSHGIKNPDHHPVKSEMVLTAAETFAAECDPAKAAQLIIDATHEPPEDSQGHGRESGNSSEG